MKAFLKKIITILVIFVTLVCIISIFSMYSLRKSAFYKPSFLTNSVQEDHFDYIVLGASTGLTTLNTAQIDSTLNIKGINLSMDDTNMSSQYAMLQHFLAEGKTTKYCIIAAASQSYQIENEGLSDNDYRFMMFANRDYINMYYKEHDGFQSKIMYHSKWLPILGVSYYNAELFYPSLLSFIKPKKRNRFDDHGNYTYPVTQVKSEKITTTKAVNLDFKNQYLKKIKSLCEANDIKLICYISPIKDKTIRVETPTFKVINHSDIIKNSEYFYDNIHVNSIGRVKTSEAFAIDFKSELN